jgi:hypothetical protein
MIEHHPSRPQWTCMVDGDDWPCELARKTLVEYHTDQQALTRQLVHLMSLAADDLRVGPARLCRRFMTWDVAQWHGLPGMWPPGTRRTAGRAATTVPLRRIGHGRDGLGAVVSVPSRIRQTVRGSRLARQDR